MSVSSLPFYHLTLFLVFIFPIHILYFPIIIIYSLSYIIHCSHFLSLLLLSSISIVHYSIVLFYSYSLSICFYYSLSLFPVVHLFYQLYSSILPLHSSIHPVHLLIIVHLSILSLSFCLSIYLSISHHLFYHILPFSIIIYHFYLSLSSISLILFYNHH